MIRAATTDDLSDVRKCAVGAYSKYVGRMGRKPAPMIADFDRIQTRGSLFVAEADGEVVGFIETEPST